MDYERTIVDTAKHRELFIFTFNLENPVENSNLPRVGVQRAVFGEMPARQC